MEVAPWLTIKMATAPVILPFSATTEENVHDVVDIGSDEFKAEITNKFKSKLSVHFRTRAIQDNFQYRGRLISNIAEVKKAWKEEFTIEMCVKYFKLFVGAFEDESNLILSQMVYKVMDEMNLQRHDSGKNNQTHMCKECRKVKVHSLSSTLLHNIISIRDSFRKFCTRSNRANGPGVSLTASAPNK